MRLPFASADGHRDERLQVPRREPLGALRHRRAYRAGEPTTSGWLLAMRSRNACIGAASNSICRGIAADVDPPMRQLDAVLGRDLAEGRKTGADEVRDALQRRRDAHVERIQRAADEIGRHLGEQRLELAPPLLLRHVDGDPDDAGDFAVHGDRRDDVSQDAFFPLLDHAGEGPYFFPRHHLGQLFAPQLGPLRGHGLETGPEDVAPEIDRRGVQVREEEIRAAAAPHRERHGVHQRLEAGAGFGALLFVLDLRASRRESCRPGAPAAPP